MSDKKIENSKKKSTLIQIKVSDTELEKVDGFCERLGVSRSTFFHMLIRNISIDFSFYQTEPKTK